MDKIIGRTFLVPESMLFGRREMPGPFTTTEISTPWLVFVSSNAVCSRLVPGFGGLLGWTTISHALDTLWYLVILIQHQKGGKMDVSFSLFVTNVKILLPNHLNICLLLFKQLFLFIYSFFPVNWSILLSYYTNHCC